MPFVRTVGVAAAIAGLSLAALALSACGKAAPPANAAANTASNALSLTLPSGAPQTGPAPASAAMVHFVNSPAAAQSPDLQAHFVNFQLDYPSDWTVDPSVGTPSASSFISLSRKNPVTHQGVNFIVAPLVGAGPDGQNIGPLLLQAEQMLRGQFPGYQRIDGSELTFGGQTAAQLRFSSSEPATGSAPSIVGFGRLIMIPGVGPGGDGLMILMAAANDPTVPNIDALGATGELAQIVSSFQVTRSTASATPTQQASPQLASNGGARYCGIIRNTTEGVQDAAVIQLDPGGGYSGTLLLGPSLQGGGRFSGTVADGVCSATSAGGVTFYGPCPAGGQLNAAYTIQGQEGTMRLSTSGCP